MPKNPDFISTNPDSLESKPYYNIDGSESISSQELSDRHYNSASIEEKAKIGYGAVAEHR